jgi:tRNA pseudouridine38-40 synthase
MPTYRLTLEYEGTRYSGWQVQSNTPKTVQGRLQFAASEAWGRVEIGGSGRTDAGVHAAAQVAHLRLRDEVRPEEIRKRLNDALAHDINILRVERAADRFHARHDASSRIYLYQISVRRSAFAKPFVWWIRDPLDLDRMQEAAALLVGMHDFVAFTDRRNEAGSTKVLVEFLELGRSDDLILIRIAASHFLWKMVRKVVAALAEVGRGNLTVAAVGEILREGVSFQPTAPPSGLFLEAVLYEGDVFDRPLEPLVPVSSWAPRRVEGKSWRARKTRS